MNIAEKLEAGEKLTLTEIREGFGAFPADGPTTAFRGLCKMLCKYVEELEVRARAADAVLKEKVDDLVPRVKAMARDLERVVRAVEEAEAEAGGGDVAGGAGGEEEEIAPPPRPQATSTVTPAVPGQPPSASAPPPAEPVSAGKRRAAPAANPNGEK